jgi:hypothetical protein
VRPRPNGELTAYVLRPSPNRGQLLEIMKRAGVEFTFQRTFKLIGKEYPEGTAVIPLAQPYGNFAKALLESQRYPDLRDSAGHPIPPYDVTAHTLSLLMGVEAEPTYVSLEGHLRPLKRPLTGDPLIPAKTIDKSVAVYKSHVPSIDEGWTRWVLENNRFEVSKDPYTIGKLSYQSITDADVRAGNLRAKYDTIIIPDQSPRTILEGYRRGSMPEELTGGLGRGGVRALREFVEQGGTLVTLNDASDFAIEQFDLPLRDVTANLKRTEFYCPGSILRTILDTTHPIAKGMLREGVAWVEDSPVFEIKPDAAARERVRVIARYPESGTPLLSGWLLGAERIRGKAALVEVGLGRGRIYLFGFRPQYRGQSLATYPLLFNAITGAIH